MHHHSDNRVLLFDVTSIYMGPKEAFALSFLMTSIPQAWVVSVPSCYTQTFLESKA